MVPTDEVVSDLSRALAAGTAFLVTGAGFSHGAVSADGTTVPSADGLTKLLYATYATGAPPESAPLGDVFDVAIMRDGDAVAELLKRKLRIAPDVPAAPDLSTFLSLPWARIYTFNLDDLLEVVADQAGFELPAASALRSVPGPGVRYVHLNGDVEDGIGATFSERQYAERLARRDPWLTTLGAELLPATVVYIGTTIRELHLWRAIEARRLDTELALDPRPRSYLVTPAIDHMRREMLAYSKVELLQMDRETFASEVLSRVVAEGAKIWSRLRSPYQWWDPIDPPLEDTTQDSRFLLGEQPSWSDVQYMSASRAFESELSASRLTSSC